MKEFEKLLRDRIGLDAASIGSSVLARTVRLRMKACGQSDPQAYLQRLQTSPEEWRELIEAVVVSETWFFRDRGAFSALARLVQEEWLPRNPVESLRILSLPCSTGEEPYSVVMSLADAGFDLNRLWIDAADISAEVLTRARRAVYGKNSFRGDELDFRDRHFTAGKDGHTLTPAIAQRVRFHQANLLAWRPDGFAAPYDFIFCRNLLIYFDRPTQKMVLRQLRELLKDDGYLFVGPAEMPLVREGGFVSANVSLAFISRKAHENEGDKHNPARKRSPRRAAPQPPGVAKPPPAPVSSPVPKLVPAPPQVQAVAERPADLRSARALADAGKLEEAARVCESHLRQHGPSAEAYYLLGLVKDAAGEETALDFYRKALYLEPNHFEALWHMALLLEKNGDTAAAASYRRRAERAERKVAAA
jgi:chemotaxis protein methyltransferase WspC